MTWDVHGGAHAHWLGFRKLQALWANTAIATPERDTYHLESDGLAIKIYVKESTDVVRHEEAAMRRGFREAQCYGQFCLLQGHWRMPLAPESQENFITAAPGGLLTPTRVPLGMIDATAHFRGVTTQLLHP